MKKIAMPAAPMMNDAVPPVAPAARSRRVPPPQPQPDTAGKHMVKTGRGEVPQKPHNPANNLSAMPTAAGYRNGGMVKGGKG